MKTPTYQLIDILSNNAYTAKYKEIPDDVDNRDEIISEIQTVLDDDGLLPDSLRFFVVNGKTSPSELDAYLNKFVKKFKNDFYASKHFENNLLKNELLTQFTEAKKDIKQMILESKQLNDEVLTQMLVTKSMICDELIEFIQSHQSEPGQKPSKKEPQERRSFKWLKDDELLTKFYNKLIADELICNTTDINDFKIIFSHKPVSEIKKPVQWEKGAKLFAYFFQNLINNKYILQKPSWVNLEYCFTYYRVDKGEYKPFNPNVKTNYTDYKQESEGAPKGYELIDALFNLDSGHSE